MTCYDVLVIPRTPSGGGDRRSVIRDPGITPAAPGPALAGPGLAGGRLRPSRGSCITFYQIYEEGANFDFRSDFKGKIRNTKILL